MSSTINSIWLATSPVNDSQTVILMIERSLGTALLIGLLKIDIYSSQLISSIGLGQASLAAVVVAAFAEVEADY
jgi:hypothetical protein